MSLHPYQHGALKHLQEMFLSVTKVCLAAACGAGKTFVAIKYIADYLIQNPEAKILVLAHGQTVLRTQFFKACEEFETVCEKLPSVFRSALVQKASDLKKYYGTHNVIVTIPQSIRQLKKFPRFDLIVVDEGHQFYFAHKGMVQRIISKSKVKQELALTGTPSPFIKHKWPIISIPMNTLLPEYVEDVIVELAASSYLTKFDIDYERQTGEINGKNHSRIFTKEATEDTLDNLLQFIHKRARSVWEKHPTIANALIKAPDWLVAFKALQKTMIACKSQKQARDVKAYFEARGIKTLISISDDQDSKSAQDTFDRFKSDPDALILVVVGRGILGFNYPDLANVVDMTCSINIDRVFQLMARTVRKSKKVKQKLFLKIVPDMFEGYKGQDYFHHMMAAVMSLTDEYWFTHYDGMNFLRLKIPSTRTRSEVDHVKHSSRKKRLPVAPCWLGLPSVEFFKKLWHRDRKGHYSYEFTTLGLVRKSLLGVYFRESEGEDASNSLCVEVCKFVKGNEKYPSSISTGREKYLASWLYGKRQAKKGRGGGVHFYESDQKIAESFELHSLFDLKDYSSESAEKCHELCKWVTEHKSNPSKESKNIREGLLGCYLSNRKRASKVGDISLEKNIACKYGLSDLFSKTNPKTLSNEKCRRVCQWIIEKRKKPYSRTKGEEGFLGRWLGTRIGAKNGASGKASFYDSDQAIADSYGLSSLFDKLDKEKASNQSCIEVCEYKRVHGKNPPQTTKLGRWLATRRKIKEGKCRGTFYDSDQKISESYGFSDLFVPGRDDRK